MENLTDAEKNKLAHHAAYLIFKQLDQHNYLVEKFYQQIENRKIQPDDVIDFEYTIKIQQPASYARKERK